MSYDVLQQVAAHSTDASEYLHFLDILGLDSNGELSTQMTPNGPSPTKVPHSEIPKIIQRYLDGESYRQIASTYGVTAGAIHHHVRSRLSAEQIRDERKATDDACGTPNGYRRHRHAKQKACKKCLDAWNKYCTEIKEKKPA